MYSLIKYNLAIIFSKEKIVKNYSKWKDEEVKKLFDYVELYKSKGESLTNIFLSFAKQTNRMPNSVRNYYYHELNNLIENSKRREKLKIDISLHKKIDQKEFTIQETESVVTEILKLINNGMSVRKACLTLAKGDVSMMVRYQNKFRAVILKDKDLYQKCLSSIGGQILKPKTKTPSNVIKMPDRRNILSESDINSLFLGLVKLVKKQAQDELSKLYEKDKQKANESLRRILVETAEKDNLIKDLRKQFKVLKQEKDKLCEEVKLLRGKAAEFKIHNQKINALKNFTKNYKNKTIKELNS